MTQFKGFKFVATLVLVFKKIENEDKTKYYLFQSHSIAEKIITESAWTMYLNQSMLQSYQTYKYL